MEEKVIDRIFTELDNHSKRLVDLSEVVHANAAILGLVTKLVVAIILFIVITSLGALYNHFKASPVLYHRQIAPVEKSVHPSGDTGNGDNKLGPGGA
ncbi:MAG: hypothetical protein GY797_01590 [Deltaproteobacteria bacterium]|nr:hypothetical protein [Deltaproteobacteria bacterium]